MQARFADPITAKLDNLAQITQNTKKFTKSSDCFVSKPQNSKFKQQKMAKTRETNKLSEMKLRTSSRG